MCWERAHDAGGANVPEKNGFVIGATDKHVAFGGEGDRVDVVMMTKESIGVWFSLDECQLSAN